MGRWEGSRESARDVGFKHGAREVDNGIDAAVDANAKLTSRK